MKPSPSDDDSGLAAVKGLAQVLLLTMSSGSSGQQYDCLPSYTTEPLYAYSQSDLQREPDSLAYFYQVRGGQAAGTRLRTVAGLP